MTIEQIGCCGAYCRNCKLYESKDCKGCKTNYGKEQKDIESRCKIRVCCIKKGYNSCVDCRDFGTCEIINSFYSKNGNRYEKYKDAAVFIEKNGYRKFIKIADKWTSAHGKFE